MSKKMVIGVILSLLIFVDVYAQKKILDAEAIKNWQYLTGDVAITSDASFIVYSVEQNRKRTLHIESNSRNWKQEIAFADHASINSDRFVLFSVPGDSMEVLDLFTKQVSLRRTIGGYKSVSKGMGFAAWIERTDSLGNLIIFQSGIYKEISSENVVDFWLDEMGNTVLYMTKSQGLFSLIWYDLKKEKQNCIWRGEGIPKGLVLDNISTKAAFFILDSKKRQNDTVYIVGPAVPTHFVSSHQLDSFGRFLILPFGLQFGNSGSRLFFKYRNPNIELSQNTKPIDVDIWSYKDSLLQSQQLYALGNRNKDITAVYDLDHGTINSMMVNTDEKIIQDPYNNDSIRYLLVEENLHGPTEMQVSDYGDAMKRLSLISITDGARKLVLSYGYCQNATLSPFHHFVVFFDAVKGNFFSYEIISGIIRNISRSILYNLSSVKYSKKGPPIKVPEGRVIGGWSSDGRYIYLYDRFDLWKVDLFAEKKPINITHFYGRKNQYVLRLLDRQFKYSILPDSGNVLFKLFDSKTYKEGFCTLNIDKRNVEFLISSNHVYTFRQKSGEYYIVSRENSSDAPNWFISKDLMHFERRTNIQPQSRYKWHYSKVIKWKSLDGVMLHGILHFPDDFDSLKKYPVIITFYQGKPDGGQKFLHPKLSSGSIDPSWYTNHGYLVCEPDILYQFGETGRSAFRSVVSCAKYLAHLAWVDSKKMGLSGSSFGAFQVNYLVTKTKMFAAAAPAFGPVDLVGLWGSLRGFKGKDGASSWIMETGQVQIGGTPWSNKLRYFQNSPIYFADKVSTPLLVLHNKEDYSAPWAQGLEWYMALRRLGKVAWLLQYDEEGHGLSDEKNELDYTIRLQQFFDHYLKAYPPPIWMTKGIPAKFKGIETGFELDADDNCSATCPICKKKDYKGFNSRGIGLSKNNFTTIIKH